MKLLIFLKKLNHSLKPITMTSYHKKTEKNFYIKNMHDHKRKIDCFCVKEEMSTNGKLIWISSIVMIVGIFTAILISIGIVKVRRLLAEIGWILWNYLLLIINFVKDYFPCQLLYKKNNFIALMLHQNAKDHLRRKQKYILTDVT